MSQNGQTALAERSPGANPYPALHVLPSAPQELIVEVYWHLVYRLQEEGAGDPTVGPRLEALNQAYARVIDPTTRAIYEEYRPRAPKQDEAAGRGSRRLLGKRPPQAAPPAPAPWEVLRLAPDAPKTIVDLAYHFWHARLRGAFDTEEQLDELDRAYRALGGVPVAPAFEAVPAGEAAGPGWQLPQVTLPAVGLPSLGGLAAAGPNLAQALGRGLVPTLFALWEATWLRASALAVAAGAAAVPLAMPFVGDWRLLPIVSALAAVTVLLVLLSETTELQSRRERRLDLVANLRRAAEAHGAGADNAPTE